MRIVAVSDTHIGITTHGKLNPHVGINSRLDDFSKSLTFIIDKCLEQNIDLFLFGGDAYKDSNPTSTYKERFEAQIQRLIDYDIPVVMITGNHDTTDVRGVSSSLQSLDTLSDIFLIETPKNVHITAKNGEEVTITCLPWPTRKMLLEKGDQFYYLSPDKILGELQAYIIEKINTLYNELSFENNNIFLGHIDIDEGLYSSEQYMNIKNTLVFPLELFKGFDKYAYIGFGHLHKYQHLRKNSALSPIVYSGSIERIDFGEERENKGFCLFEIIDNKCIYFKHIKTPAREFITIHVTLDKLDPTNSIIEEISRYTIKDKIVRIFCEQTDPVIASKINLNRVHEALQEASYVASIQIDTSIKDRKIINFEERKPIKIIEEYINRFDMYVNYKQELLSLSKKYLEG